MEWIVSIIAILVMVIVTIVLLYNNALLKDRLNANMQNIVDQINDSTMYAFKFDTNQDTNIKNLDRNMKIVNEQLNNVMHNVKVLQMNCDGAANAVGPRVATASVAHTAPGPVKVGTSHTLSSGSDGWVRINDAANKDFSGGLASANLYVTRKATFDGPICLGNTCITSAQLAKVLKAAGA